MLKVRLLKGIGNLSLLLGAIVISAGIHSCGDLTPDGTGNPIFQEPSSCSCLENKPKEGAFVESLNARSHHIEPEKALEMVKAFKAARSEMAVSGGFTENALPEYETFNLAAIHKILCQPSAVGFRIYPGLDSQKEVYFILVGVDPDGKDVIQRMSGEDNVQYKRAMTSGAVSESSIIIVEAGQRYP